MRDHQPQPFTVIIPARYASTRLPGKPLMEINGRPLLEHVYRTAKQSTARKIIIATDDKRIAILAKSFDADVMLTSTQHDSGTDRLAEVVTFRAFDENEVVVNLQGDEFGLSALLLDQVAACLFQNPDKQVATLCEEIFCKDDYLDPNIVKVVFNHQYSAMYFSRSPIPAEKTGSLPEKVYKHIGLYAYRVGYLKRFTQRAACPLEQTEQLEQLRTLYYGDAIHVEPAIAKAGIGIDTIEDMERARSMV